MKKKIKKKLSYHFESDDFRASQVVFILSGRKASEIKIPTTNNLVLVISKEQEKDYKPLTQAKLIVSGSTPNDRRIAIHTFIKIIHL